jgi:mannose-6-phosphate isomerase-like protein (cupin superfamily)
MTMFSRRDLAALLPAFAVRAAAQQTPQQTSQSAPTQTPAPLAMLPGKIYHSADLPYTGNDDKKGRRFFLGTTHTGFALETHETILGPGKDTHAPHQHEHEEMLVIISGALEMHVEGKEPETAEAGDIVYLASNVTHNAHNSGSVPCRYVVIELRANAA